MRDLALFFSLGLLTSLPACGGVETGPGAGGHVGNATDVAGTDVDTYLTDTGQVTAPETSAQITLSALVPKAGGGFDARPGTIGSDGGFLIKDVPQGSYYLEALTTGSSSGPAFFVGSERTVTLGSLLGGRPDVKPISQATPLHLNVTGMTAWNDYDYLELYSLGANAWGPLTADTPPMAGDTSLSGFTFDCSQLVFANLVDGTKGDQAVITHLTSKPLGTGSYQAIAEAFTPSSFTQQDGEATTLAGAFKKVPQSHVSITFQRSQFDALITAANPAATMVLHDVSAYAEPAGVTHGLSAAPPTLFDFTDLDSGDFTVDLDYGNPFPSSWGVVAGASVSYRVALTVPWSGYPSAATGTISVSDVVDALAAGPVTPLLAPPGDVQINGKPGYAGGSGVGTTPTISWSAPTQGQAAVYYAAIYRVAEGKRVRAVEVVTAGTQITVPPGFLTAGSLYFLRLTARADYDPASPDAHLVKSAYAEALTDVFTP